ALCSQGHSGDAGSPVFLEATSFHRSWVRLHRHLRVRRDAQTISDGLDHTPDRLGREETGRPSSQKNADDLPPPSATRLSLEISLECSDIGGLRQIPVQRVGIEVAVGALPHTPWEVNVQRQGRQGGHTAYRRPWSFATRALSALPR